LLIFCSLTASVLVHYDYIENQNQNIFLNIKSFVFQRQEKSRVMGK